MVLSSKLLRWQGLRSTEKKHVIWSAGSFNMLPPLWLKPREPNNKRTIVTQKLNTIDTDETLTSLEIVTLARRVRYAAWGGVAQFSEDHSDVLSSEAEKHPLAETLAKHDMHPSWPVDVLNYTFDISHTDKSYIYIYTWLL